MNESKEFERFRNIPVGSKMFKKGSRRFRNVPEGFRRFKNVIKKVLKGFLKVLKG
jgi:hypothetical protein